MVPGRARLRAAAVITLVAVLALSGCSGPSTSEAEPGNASSGSSPSSEPSPGPTPTASAVPSVPQAPEPPKARRGPAGQRAFALFVMDAWSWSLRSNDASPLLDVSPSRTRPCDGCKALAKELAGRAKEGWYVDFPGLDVGRTRLRRTGDVVVATSTVGIPESDSYQADGSYRSTSPAHDDATFTVTMRLTRSGYRLVSFRVG